jgi:diadenosine tetraphosphatase ApaH/serine/threonine PP2A family protein phosphatase
MRVAALYDVHAMPWALEAVLAEVDADTVVFGGDLVAGPFPRETLELARSVDGAIFIRGNAERALADWDREHLAAEDVEWLASLPVTATVDGVLYCHATPTDDLPATTEVTPDEVVARLFAGTTGTVVIGHTHTQFDRRVSELRVVNAGAVGMPYEDDVAAFWLLVEDGSPSHRRTPIDIERAAAAIRATAWPGGEEFVTENLLAPPSRAEAIAYMETLPR